MSALCCPRARTGPGWFSALKEALRRVFFSTEETAPPLQPSRAKVNERATALLDRHGESILRLAYSYLHNQSDAEDILQDTLIQYLRTSPTLESPAHEKAWLLRVAGNLSKNLLRAQGYRQADQLEETLVAQERDGPLLRLGRRESPPRPLPRSHPPVLLRGLLHRPDRPDPGPERVYGTLPPQAGAGKAQALVGGGGCPWISRRRTPIVNSWNK